ncbi:hypothetical protein [Flavobacterium foetidum]|uniref:hypothetical protein n=1 Tax=Flavobacterium foetidum TaxID=2026681 RepID=UPI001075160F|nr:hypothetical protein [Flavobacterium foetidum]KAF2517777.1 hypothetical protein E0W73_00805 [Flavobacterium foetidum]
MKKINVLLSLCLFILLFSCGEDDSNEISTGTKSSSTSKFINLDELKNDNSTYLQFQQLQLQLDNLRNSELFGDTFIFLINTDKILQINHDKSTTLTFPIYRSENSQYVENLVLQINADGSNASYLVKYNLTNSDITQISSNNEDINLTNKTQVTNLSDLTKLINSKLKSSAKTIIQAKNKCYEFVKKKEVVGQHLVLSYDFIEVNCLDAPDTSVPFTIIDPNTLPSIIPNVTHQAPENPYDYMGQPYTLGYDFSSYPVLDDPIEENNIQARMFFDRLTTNMRKWVLANSGLYDKILIKLTAENWDMNYQLFAINVIGQITDFHIQHWADINPPHEEEIFNILLAGGKITND